MCASPGMPDAIALNGIMLISVFAFLILTGYGLYYFGDERLRS